MDAMDVRTPSDHCVIANRIPLERRRDFAIDLSHCQIHTLSSP